MVNFIIKIISVIFIVIGVFIKAQILLNNNICFQIYLEKDYMINNQPSHYNKDYFIIKNNTSTSYIINIRGFMGEGAVFESGKLINPYLIMPLPLLAEWEEEDCIANILIIPAGTKIRTVLYPSVFRGWYDINNNSNYELDFKTEHNRKSPYYFGCKNYVDSLVNNGYKIFEGTLSGRVRLVP